MYLDQCMKQKKILRNDSTRLALSSMPGFLNRRVAGRGRFKMGRNPHGFFLNTKNYAVLEKTGRGVIWVEKRWSML
jgi:hypothetical protein